MSRVFLLQKRQLPPQSGRNDDAKDGHTARKQAVNPGFVATQWLHGAEKKKAHYLLNSELSFVSLVGRE